MAEAFRWRERSVWLKINEAWKLLPKVFNASIRCVLKTFFNGPLKLRAYDNRYQLRFF